MDTPICDFVRAYARTNALRLHMPGHKGAPLLGMEHLDITEIDGADSLYEASGIIARSEENASRLFGCKTMYSTEGSSQCIRAMLYLVQLHARQNGRKPRIAAGRNAHKSFLTAAALLELEVDWLYPKANAGYLSCMLTPADLTAYLEQAPEIPAAIYLTDPDYLGNLVDLASIAEVCRRYGVLLVVDNAHGAYLKFLPRSRHPMDLGADLWSDFTKDASMNRVLMQNAQTEALSGLSGHVSLALRNPNDYALSSAAGLYDMPCSDSGFRLEDESVPFYQAVVRGSIDYVSEPLNYQDDVHMAWLQAVEFGAGLQYTLSWETTALLKETDYSWINRGRYADWAQTIEIQCEKAGAVLSPLAGQAMTDHERLARDVYKTTYESGDAVVVNYSAEAVTVDGVTIPATDFALVKAGEP